VGTLSQGNICFFINLLYNENLDKIKMQIEARFSFPLPFELILHICHYLDWKDVLSLAKLNSKFNTILDEDNIWEIFFNNINYSFKDDSHLVKLLFPEESTKIQNIVNEIKSILPSYGKPFYFSSAIWLNLFHGRVGNVDFKNELDSLNDNNKDLLRQCESYLNEYWNDTKKNEDNEPPTKKLWKEKCKLLMEDDDHILDGLKLNNSVTFEYANRGCFHYDGEYITLTCFENDDGSKAFAIAHSKNKPVNDCDWNLLTKEGETVFRELIYHINRPLVENGYCTTIISITVHCSQWDSPRKASTYPELPGSGTAWMTQPWKILWDTIVKNYDMLIQ